MTAPALDWARRHGPAVAIEAGVNFALPFAVFTAVRPSLGEAGALMAAAVPPLAWTVVELVRRRRIDALSLIVLTGIALSLLAFFGGGGARFLQLREQLVVGVIGLIFLGSAAIGRPLIYQLARARLKRQTGDAAVLEAMRDAPGFRRAMLVMTLAWGFGLLAESALAAVLVFALTIPQFLIVSPILGLAWTATLTAWTFWYARRRLTAVRASLDVASLSADAGPDAQARR